MGRHNVVMAALPEGEYGIAAATSVTRDMLHTFTNVRIGLMVGIAGVLPVERMMSASGTLSSAAPREGRGGVLQYDFGKTIQEQEFQITGFLNQPPTLASHWLIWASGPVRNEDTSSKVPLTMSLRKKPRLRKNYARPDPSKDILFRSGVVHGDSEAACESVCPTAETDLIVRRERTEEEDNPAIHYGRLLRPTS